MIDEHRNTMFPHPLIGGCFEASMSRESSTVNADNSFWPFGDSRDWMTPVRNADGQVSIGREFSGNSVGVVSVWERVAPVELSNNVLTSADPFLVLGFYMDHVIARSDGNLIGLVVLNIQGDLKSIFVGKRPVPHDI